VLAQLVDLKDAVYHYQDSLTGVLTSREDADRLSAEDNAYRIGEELTVRVNSMITAAHRRLQEMTRTSLARMSRTKYILFSLAALGPLLAVGLGYLFIRGISEPLNMILEATKKLKHGDLSHRIGPLKDEFGEVAESFNEMAGSLMTSMAKKEESEKRYRTLFERAGEAIFIFEVNGEPGCQIADANLAAAEMYGYAMEELRTMRFTDLEQPGSEALKSSPFDQIARGEWVRTELTHRRKDGSTFIAGLNSGPIEIGDRTYVLSFHRDISAQKNVEEALQRAKQFKSGGIISAGLAHDLKNSIGGIKIAVEVLLEETSLSAEDRQVLRDVLREVRRVETVTKSLLDFMRPSKPQLMQEDINTILDSVIAELFGSAAGRSAVPRQVSVVKEYDTDLPKAMVDPVQLQQVFLNILRNAIEAMPEGGTISLKTQFAPARREIEVIVSDTGKGVGTEIRNMIFEPFFTTKPKAGGLGLSIAKRLVEQHNGTILLEHNDGKSGAVFRISFPVTQSEEAGTL
jgi:PAS domain S-box-containing protein